MDIALLHTITCCDDIGRLSSMVWLVDHEGTGVKELAIPFTIPINVPLTIPISVPFSVLFSECPGSDV